MKKTIVLVSAMILANCAGDETVVAYGAADKVWRLVEIDDNAIDYTATLTFPEPGRLTGRAACNSFSTSMTTPYPWFETGPIATTRAICPEIKQEQTFLEALSEMTLSEVLGDTLILSTPEGRSMVFKADA